MRKIGSGLLALALLTAAALPSAAQENRPVGPDELDRALDARVEEVRTDRAVVERVLSDDRVEAAADAHGLDIEQARSAAATLEGEDLSRAAEEARRLETAMAAQDVFGLTMTQFLIGLAAIILLVILLA